MWLGLELKHESFYVLQKPYIQSPEVIAQIYNVLIL